MSTQGFSVWKSPYKLGQYLPEKFLNDSHTAVGPCLSFGASREHRGHDVSVRRTLVCFIMIHPHARDNNNYSLTFILFLTGVSQK